MSDVSNGGEARGTPTTLLAIALCVAALVGIYGVAIYTAWLIGDQPRYGAWDGALLVTYFLLWALVSALVVVSGRVVVGWWRARSL